MDLGLVPRPRVGAEDPDRAASSQAIEGVLDRPDEGTVHMGQSAELGAAERDRAERAPLEVLLERAIVAAQAGERVAVLPLETMPLDVER